jgi:hypothetical protein
VNLYPGDSIDVGVTRTPAPASAAAPEPAAAPRLAPDAEPHGPEKDDHAEIIGPYIREPIGEMWRPVSPPEPPLEPHERILRIIAETVTEATEGDGADLDDLVRRLEAEEFTLPSLGTA